jgi:hypothetical protein
MRSAGLIGVVLALGAAYFVYTAQLSQPALGGAASPREQIDVVGIKAALLEIGQAERIYVNAHGAYGTLEELRADGAPDLGTDRRGYVFRIEPRGAQGFQATAAPSDPGKSDWPTLTIDETMQVASR